jgi:hypothetical protein
MNLNVVAFGGGTDSTAMIIGMFERGIRIDLALFADTGGERPETYAHVEAFSRWMVRNRLPAIITVRGGVTLEQDCLTRQALPSVAYGFKTCSQRFKMRPQENYLKAWQPALDQWEAGGKVTKFIGYDASEDRRAKIYMDDKYDYSYPLIEWGWDRARCIEVIEREGIALPGKSACFFCPSSKKREILSLTPDLQARAIAMEDNAELTSIKGLGRDFAWRDLLAFDEAQIKLFPESRVEMACGCFDGDDA